MGVNTSSMDHFVVMSAALQRIGKPEPADHEVGGCRIASIELPFHILALHERGSGRQQGELIGQVRAMQVGRADLDQWHAEFARQKARKGTSSWESGKKKMRLPASGSR